MDKKAQLNSAIPVGQSDEHSANLEDIIQLQVKEGLKVDEDSQQAVEVEREAIDYHDVSNDAGNYVDDKCIAENTGHLSREVLESQEKVRELELEQEKVAETLKRYEPEKTQLKEEISLLGKKLAESHKLYEELQLRYGKLQERASESNSAQQRVLQEEMEAAEVKQRELDEKKSSFDGLALELQNSRKRMQELEHEVEHFIGEAHLFEERLKQFRTKSQSEAQRALEYEKLLEDAKLRSRQMEDQIASLGNEVEGLYNKISGYIKVEETLRTTAAQLSIVQHNMEHSKSQVLELEQRLASKEALIEELTQEMELTKAVESKVKGDLSALEDLYTSTRDDLKRKESELEDVEKKLKEETYARDLLEAKLKSEEEGKLVLQGELAKAVKEAHDLETTVDDLSTNIAEKKEVCNHLENKLKLWEENFCQADSNLSQALSINAELEEKLKTLEDLHRESETKEASATKKNIELETIIRALNTAAEEANVREMELMNSLNVSTDENKHLEEASGKLNLKLTEAENLLEVFRNESSSMQENLQSTETELKAARMRICEMSVKLKSAEEQLEKQKRETEQITAELELDYHSLKRDSEEKLQNAATSLKSKDLEAKSLFQKVDFLQDQVDDYEKQVAQMNIRFGSLTKELEASLAKLASLEMTNQELKKQALEEEEKNSRTSLENELLVETNNLLKRQNDDLQELLKSTISEKEAILQQVESQLKSIAELSEQHLRDFVLQSVTEGHALEAENLLEVFGNELSSAKENLQSAETELKAARMRESEMSVKLKSAEEQLENQKRETEQITTELESEYHSLKRYSEEKLQEAVTSLNNKDLEAKSLFQKVNFFQDQVENYEKQVAQINKRFGSLTKELEESLAKLASLEMTNQELKKRAFQEEEKNSRTSLENELLVETNNQLKRQNDHFQELLKSTISEKEAIVQQVASQLKIVEELSEQHLRDFVLQSVTEGRAFEAEKQLQEIIQEYRKKELETKELNENNAQLGNANVELTQEKQMSESRIKDLQLQLSAALAEKVETIKLAEDPIQQFPSKREGSQGEISTADQKVGAEKTSRDVGFERKRNIFSFIPVCGGKN